MVTTKHDCHGSLHWNKKFWKNEVIFLDFTREVNRKALKYLICKQNIAEDSDKMEKFLALSLRKAVKTQMDFSDSVKKEKKKKRKEREKKKEILPFIVANE